MNVVAYTERRGGDPLAAPPTELNPVGEFQMINVGDFRMIIDTSAICAASSPRTSTITNEPARICHSTRIAHTHVRSCHAGSEGWSPSRESAACITVTNVSPPDSSRILIQQSLPRGQYAVV